MSIKSNIFKSGCVAILASSCILGAYAYSENPAVTYSNSNNNLTINIDKTAAAHQAFGAFTFCCLSIAALSAGYGTRIGLQIRKNGHIERPKDLLERLQTEEINGENIENFRNELIKRFLEECFHKSDQR
jgi:hypothetical protein